MKNKAIAVAKINLRHVNNLYLIVGIVLACLASSYITNIVFIDPGYYGDNSIISANCALIGLPVMAAILIPALNMRRIINLGAKRQDFLKGTALVYVLFSAIAALLMIVISYTVDRAMLGTMYFAEVMDMLRAFGFIYRGPVVAFLQMFAFMLLFAAFAHTLTVAQGSWRGWMFNAAIIAVICVFTPIEPLRNLLIGLFYLIIFNSNAALQIISCLVLAAVVYMLSKPTLAKKAF